MKKTEYTNQPFPIPPMVDEAPAGCPFKMGDQVRFINENGVVFGPYEIQGFTLPGYETHGGKGIIYLDYSCYWFPTQPESLTPWQPEMAVQAKRGYLLPGEK